MCNEPLILGSRASALAMAQTQLVIDFLREKYPERPVTMLAMKTTGDRILDRKLDEIGGKGLFVKELDAALLEGRTHYSVHSLKDVPMELPEGLPLVCCSRREDPRDALVLPAGAREIDFSRPIGTSSPRRLVQLRTLFPGAKFESVRGNLQTRLRKLDEGQFGALVLAAAGLKRMGLQDRISRLFGVDEMIPAAGQGILAVQGTLRSEPELFEGFADPDSMVSARAERAFVRRLQGSCASPIAACALREGDAFTLRGLYWHDATGKYYTARARLTAEDAVQAAEAMADELKRRAAEEEMQR